MGKKAAAFRIFIGPLSGVFHPSSAITWARATFRQQQADKKRLANYIPLASGEVCDPPKRFRSVDGAFIKLVVFFLLLRDYSLHFISLDVHSPRGAKAFSSRRSFLFIWLGDVLE